MTCKHISALLDLANYAIMTVIEMKIAADDTTTPKED